MLFGMLACRGTTSTDPRPTTSARAPALAPSPATPASASSRPELAPLEGAWLEPLQLDDGSNAPVCPPIGAREPRPVLVAVHGAADRPEWACGGWRLASKSYPFVVCPRGVPVGGGNFGWPSSRAIEAAIDRALAALQRRYGERIAEGSPVYAGFSQGAILARPVLVRAPARFPAVILAEGGYDTLTNAGFARAFREAGGERVLIVCGGAGCFGHAARAQPILERAGLEVLVAGDRSAGHNLNARMQAALQEVWPRFVAGRSGWAAFPNSIATDAPAP